MIDLFKCAMVGDLQALKMAASSGGLDVTNEMGSTLLFYAVMSDNPTILEFLTNAGLSINAQRKDGETPLHIACIRNKLNAARWLLANGANPDLKDQWSRRAIDCVGEGNAELRTLLSEASQKGTDNPLSTSEFTRLLLARLKDRWQCSHPKGLSDTELKDCFQNGEHMPEIYRVFLQTCGKEMGQMFRSYEFRPCETVSAKEDFEGFLNSYAIRIHPAMHFLTYLREEYWAFSRHRNGRELDDPNVLHITVQGVQPTIRRLSDFLLTWEQFE